VGIDRPAQLLDAALGGAVQLGEREPEGQVAGLVAAAGAAQRGVGQLGEPLLVVALAVAVDEELRDGRLLGHQVERGGGGHLGGAVVAELAADVGEREEAGRALGRGAGARQPLVDLRRAVVVAGVTRHLRERRQHPAVVGRQGDRLLEDALGARVVGHAVGPDARLRQERVAPGGGVGRRLGQLLPGACGVGPVASGDVQLGEQAEEVGRAGAQAHRALDVGDGGEDVAETLGQDVGAADQEVGADLFVVGDRLDLIGQDGRGSRPVAALLEDLERAGQRVRVAGAGGQHGAEVGDGGRVIAEPVEAEAGGLLVELDLVVRIAHLGGEGRCRGGGLGPLAGLLAQAQPAIERRREVGRRRQRVAERGVGLVEPVRLLEQRGGGGQKQRAAGRVAQHAGARGGDGG
jgi:hypothetical protein